MLANPSLPPSKQSLMQQVFIPACHSESQEVVVVLLSLLKMFTKGIDNPNRDTSDLSLYFSCLLTPAANTPPYNP